VLLRGEIDDAVAELTAAHSRRPVEKVVADFDRDR
jgi:hypothetical protein